MASDNRGELPKELNKIDSIKNDEKSNKMVKVNNNSTKLKNNNINNATTAITVHSDSQNEKKTFCTNDVKKHISILCKFKFVGEQQKKVQCDSNERTYGRTYVDNAKYKTTTC